MRNISIKRILIGLIIGIVFVGLIIYLINYLFCSSVSMVVEFKTGINEEATQTILLKYEDNIVIGWGYDREEGHIFEISVPHRITGYFIKSKLSKEVNVKSIKFGTILGPIKPFKN